MHQAFIKLDAVLVFKTKRVLKTRRATCALTQGKQTASRREGKLKTGTFLKRKGQPQLGTFLKRKGRAQRQASLKQEHAYDEDIVYQGRERGAP